MIIICPAMSTDMLFRMVTILQHSQTHFLAKQICSYRSNRQQLGDQETTGYKLSPNDIPAWHYEIMQSKAGASIGFTSTSTSTCTRNICEYEYESEYLITIGVLVRIRLLVCACDCEYRPKIHYISGILALPGIERTIELSVIWDALTLMWRHCNSDVT